MKAQPTPPPALSTASPTPAPIAPTPPPKPLQCRSYVADAKVVHLTEQNFKVDSQCAKFGALLSNQTCPEGYCITPGTLVNKRVYKHGVCVSVQTVLCQCGSTNCPSATCKTYTPKTSNTGFEGFTADNGALYKGTFSARSHVNLSAAVEAKVISTIKEWTQDFIKIRSAKIAACSEAIERDNSAKGATGTGMTGSCYKATGLKCCTAPWEMKAPIIGREYTWTKSGYNGYPIPGSHQWEDTPTRCTLDNPLV